MISVALCTYNGERFLEKQLQSILEQTLQVDEIIIHDDASSDKSFSIAEKFGKQNPRVIKTFRNPKNFGPVKNFERCIKACGGDIIFLADQDDVWYKNKVEKVLNFFAEEKKALLVFSNGDLIDNAEKLTGKTLWDEWQFTEELRKQWKNNDFAFDHLVRNKNKITGATIAFKSKLKEHIFPFRSHELYWHDAWMGMYAAKEHGLFFIEESLIRYRVHNQQLVGIGNGTTCAPLKNKNSQGKILKNIKKIFR